MIKKRRFKFKFTFLFSFFFTTLIISGCVTVEESYKLKRVNDVPESQILSESDDELFSKRMPEITADEYELLGDALLKRGNLHLAFLQYERSLKRNPQNIRVEYKKGLTLLVGEKNENAIEQFQKVLEKDSGFALAYEGMGRAFFQMKEYDKAETYFWKALELEPKLWKSHNFLGNIYDFQKRYEKAAQEYISALVVKPHEGLLYNNVGVSYFLAGKLEVAVEALQEAIALRYINSKVYNNLGLALANLGQYSEALEAFKNGGGEARAHNNLGCIYLRQGKFEEAIRCFEKAIEIEPGFYARASENLKKARAGNGQL